MPGYGYGISNEFIKPKGLGSAYLLDAYGDDIAVACSLRKLSSTYTGFVLRVWRAADGAVADLSFDDERVSLDSSITAVTGGVTATNFGEFVADAGYPDPDGLGTPSDLGIQTWYDQSGNAKDITWAGNPVGVSWSNWSIYNSSTGLRVVDINGTDFPVLFEISRIGAVNSITSPYPGGLDPRSIFGVSWSGAGSGAGTSTMRWNTLRFDYMSWSSATLKFTLKNAKYGTTHTVESINTFAANTVHLADYTYNEAPGTTTIHVNGNLEGTSTTFESQYQAPTGYNGIAIDMESSGNQPDFLENIVFLADKSADASAIRDNINSHYGIY